MFTKRVIFSLGFIVYIIVCSSSAHARQLNDFVLSNKKEGWYPAGVPMIRYNSDDGFGYGLRAVIYNNGKINDRYFKYSPYFHMYSLQLFQTTMGKKEFMINTDMPYFRKTRMRLYTSLRYAEELNASYFGSGPDAMDLRGKDGKLYDDYEQYKKEFLIGYGSGCEYYKYNKFSIKRPDIDIYGYYEIFDDIKLMAGIRARYTDVTPWGGRTFDIRRRGQSQGHPRRPGCFAVTCRIDDDGSGADIAFGRVSICHIKRVSQERRLASSGGRVLHQPGGYRRVLDDRR